MPDDEGHAPAGHAYIAREPLQHLVVPCRSFSRQLPSARALAMQRLHPADLTTRMALCSNCCVRTVKLDPMPRTVYDDLAKAFCTYA